MLTKIKTPVRKVSNFSLDGKLLKQLEKLQKFIQIERAIEDIKKGVYDF